jgi:hypothetical protein
VKSERAQTRIHLGILGVAIATAAFVSTRDKENKALASGEVIVWSARSGDVEKVSYESKSRKVSVEAKKDATGRYFVGSIEKDAAPAPHPVDGGVPAAPPSRTTVGFMSVGTGEKLADALAPLRALRALGKVAPDRAADFGLSDPEATVSVRIAGTEHQLVIGATTPGGSDRYVKDPASSEVYVVKGDPIRNLESADSMLLERDLHEWKDAEVARAHVTAGDKGRDIVRGGPENKRFWADQQTPETNDETLGNWMSKLERLRPTEFALTDPEGREPLLKVDYVGGKKPLGSLELVKVKGADKPTFYLRTERTRLYGKVVGTAAEQLEQDLGAIVK